MEHEGSSSSSLHTRSKAAPDWTVEESLILVNEVNAVEADCGETLSSFQKWKIIVQNCNALDVNRNLNQCRRKWETLLSHYKHSGSTFNAELFNAIQRYVTDFESAYHTEPDSDSDHQPQLQSGSKNQRSKMMITHQKEAVEVKSKLIRRQQSEHIEIEECSFKQQVRDASNESKRFVEMNRVEHEQNMADKLRETAEIIEAIVNDSSGRDDLTRINGDKIIICLSNLAVTLDELCKLQTDSVV
ncbi:hypothetical protein QVD17_04037 [Tagetes erecta]|uniref:Myb-like domain-containing protein n=1 Tax=Tagetes erecta TaxID=13708 RepID=A0AAD8LFI9_TARER|nr:hypothetical protein QVD17_04037 [Tagetes erecta]